MTRKPLPPLKVPESLMGRREIRDEVESSMGALYNKALAGKDLDSQEYLLGELVGLSDVHTQAFPEVWKRLQRAEKLDWNIDILAPANTKERFEIKRYGSFKNLYAELIEPWLGKYEDLREIVHEHRRGERTLEQCCVEIERRKLRTHGGDRRSKAGDQGNNCNLETRGNARAYTLARLRRDDPELAERVEAGELSANAAAVMKGWRKPRQTFAVPLDPRGAAATLRRRFKGEDLAHLIRLLQE